MEEQNPRRAEESQQPGKLKNIIYIMAGVAVVLAAALAYIWYERTSLVNDLKVEKEDLTAQMIALQNDYASLSSDYESINSQLDSSREEVSQLIEAKIRQYEKELGTLRSIMRSYIVQIDSLNTLNQKLTADAAAARREAAESRRQSEALSKTVESLSDQVAIGSQLKGRSIALVGYNGSNKVTDRSSRVVRLMTSLALVENELAPKGPVRVYIRVKGPDGILLTNEEQRTFNFNGEPLISSASREVDYQGKEVEMSIYLNDIPEFERGIYTVEVYTENSLLGSAELMLR